MQLDLHGKVASLTGSGISCAITVTLATNGIFVFINYRSDVDGARVPRSVY